MTFELHHFVSAARAAAVEDQPARAMLTLFRETLADPGAVAAAMPPIDGDDEIFHEDSTVCVSYARFDPGELVPPHNHKVAAFIGVFRGVEVNRFYRRGEAGIELVSERRVGPGSTLSIGAAGIHGVHTGDASPCEALHVYLGPLSSIERELFHPDTGAAMPFTDENYRALLRPWPEPAG